MIQCRHVTCHACACAGCAALLDELDALRGVVSVFDEATHLARGQREELIAANRDLGRLAMRQQAELDRLRELEQHVLAKRWDAAIAACRRAQEGK